MNDELVTRYKESVTALTEVDLTSPTAAVSSLTRRWPASPPTASRRAWPDQPACRHTAGMAGSTPRGSRSPEPTTTRRTRRCGSSAATARGTPVTDPNYTHMAFLLDASGSMASIKSDVEGGFNAFIAEQR